MNIRYFKYIFRTFIALFLIGFFSVKIQATRCISRGEMGVTKFLLPVSSVMVLDI